MNDKIQKIIELIGSDIDFFEFLKTIDLFQRNCLSQLLLGGGTSDYSKAFLLKISNLLVGKYQYLNRHDYLISNPYSLIVDPSNNCPLHCYGCLHNSVFQNKIRPDWPGGFLKKDCFSSFILRYGPFATTIFFYNWGEPLLNEQTPSFIAKAKKYLLNTSLSSNLSVEFDADALICSGLDYCILSIDGATADSYGKYRKGGRFDLVINNVRKLVAAKRKYNSATPCLSWQFLLFEHTKGEVAIAKAMAEELGVNDIRFAHPYDVLWEDDLVVAKDVKSELHVLGYEKGIKDNTYGVDGNISKIFDESWLEKLPDDWGISCRRRTGNTCQWLYSSLVMDANGRYLPCCYVPRKDSGFTWIFGDALTTEDPFNSQSYRFSRKHFAWLSELENPGGVAPQLRSGKSATYCTSCPDKNNEPLVNTQHLKRYIEKIDTFKVIDSEHIDMIVNWNR